MKKRLHMAAEIGANLFLPGLAFTLAESRYGEFGALIASSIPPLLWSLLELAWHRRVDALSMLVLGGIVLSLLAMAMGGDARLLLVRESLISGLVGVAFLLSLFFRRPLVFYLARATVVRQDGEQGAANFHGWWERPDARRLIRHITLIWGLGLTTEAALRIWFAWHWTPQRFLAIAPALGYAIAGCLGLWTFWAVRCHKKSAPAAVSASADSE